MSLGSRESLTSFALGLPGYRGCFGKGPQLVFEKPHEIWRSSSLFLISLNVYVHFEYRIYRLFCVSSPHWLGTRIWQWTNLQDLQVSLRFEGGYHVHYYSSQWTNPWLLKLQGIIFSPIWGLENKPMKTRLPLHQREISWKATGVIFFVAQFI